MARRSHVVVDNTTTNSLEDSNVTAASSDSLGASNSNVAIPEDSSFWESVKMANFKFAMRQFDNGNADGIAISWRGLVCKLLALRNEGSSKQVFATIYEKKGEGYTITLRTRIILSDRGIGYSLCSLLEHLALKQPNGVFVRIDIRDTLEIPQVLDLLRQRFPKPNKS